MEKHRLKAPERLFVLDRYHIENYLLEEELIAEFMRRFPTPPGQRLRTERRPDLKSGEARNFNNPFAQLIRKYEDSSLPQGRFLQPCIQLTPYSPYEEASMV